jgi:hypothetical protein
VAARIELILMHDVRADVSVPANTKVGALMDECRRRWNLQGEVSFYISGRMAFVTRYQRDNLLAGAGIRSGDTLSVAADRDAPIPSQASDPILDLGWRESEIPRDPWRIPRPTRLRTVLVGIAATAAAALWWHFERKPIPLDEALKQNLVEVRANGSGQTNSFRLSLVSTRARIFGMRIAVPAGTRFASPLPGPQAMALARSTIVEVPAGVGTRAETDVPAYCLNRFLPAPTLESSLKLDEGGGSAPEERNAVRKLIACLDASGIGHKAGQMAVWVVAENLLDKPTEEVERLFRARVEKGMIAEVERKLGSQEEFESLRKQFPDIPPERIRERVEKSKGEIAVMEVSILLQREIADYRRLAVEPLRKCGYDTASAAFFK